MLTASEKLALVIGDTLDLIRAQASLLVDAPTGEAVLDALGALEAIVADRAELTVLLTALATLLREVRLIAEQRRAPSAPALRRREDRVLYLRDRLVSRHATRGR